MPAVIPASGFGKDVQQTAKGGVTITAGATANTMGAWTTLLDPLSFDVFALALAVSGVSAATTNESYLMDIGIAPTGGGNEQIVIPFFDAGAASNSVSAMGKLYIFPLFLPAGKALRARGQCVVASRTAVVNVHVLGLPPHGFAEDAPQQWYQYGAVASTSSGTGVTSGTNAFGTAVDVTGGAGTTANHRWFHVGLDLTTNTVLSAGIYRVRLSRDSAGTDILGVWDFPISTNEDITGPHPAFPVCVPVSAGSSLFVAVNGAAAEVLGTIVYAA